MEHVCRILAVDNEPSVTTAFRFVFDDPRYNVVCVNNGADALAQLGSSSPFDVIIVDQKMPKLSGVELVSEIRKRHIEGKIIVVSANLPSEAFEEYQRMNVDLIVSKPFDVRQLRSAVEKLAA